MIISVILKELSVDIKVVIKFKISHGHVLEVLNVHVNESKKKIYFF